MALTIIKPRAVDLSETFNFTGTVTGDNVGGGNLVKISEQTASASSSISFTGIDSTYRTYLFKFINIHPASISRLIFQTSTNGGSNYGVTMTSTTFGAYHAESNSEATLQYLAGSDNTQTTAFQELTPNIATTNDASCSGELWLFNPSSTTYVKHYMSNINTENQTYSFQLFSAGYFNTTSAVNAVQFKMNSGNIDDGTITMYGIA